MIINQMIKYVPCRWACMIYQYKSNYNDKCYLISFQIISSDYEQAYNNIYIKILKKLLFFNSSSLNKS